MLGNLLFMNYQLIKSDAYLGQNNKLLKDILDKEEMTQVISDTELTPTQRFHWLLDSISQRKVSVQVPSFNVGGLAQYKLSTIVKLSYELSLLLILLQEVGQKVLKDLRKQNKIAIQNGKERWFVSQARSNFPGVAIFVCQEHLPDVTDIYRVSCRILAIKNSSWNNIILFLGNVHVRHSVLLTRECGKLLETLQGKVPKRVNKRRFIVVEGDRNAQVKRTRKNSSSKNRHPSRRNKNGRRLEELLLQNTANIVNHKPKTQKKGSRRHATSYPWNNQKKYGTTTLVKHESKLELLKLSKD
eukprot:snap_masked-scaffold_19-processed-gene-6.51-mRNA-1 protein AED:1.00 eAED:1.00 QI:0/-1/0/0/-1/1/1/0/299